MNKMIKGAVVAGLGVALLLGGGGTLAVWNAEQEANAGSIVAGDLNLTAETGAWTSSATGTIANIDDYRVVPGEKLSYTQTMDVTLTGDAMSATLKTVGVDNNSDFNAANVKVVGPVLTNTAGQVQPSTELTESQKVTATVTFEFLSTTTARESVNATHDFSKVGFQLEQKAPAGN